MVILYASRVLDENGSQITTEFQPPVKCRWVKCGEWFPNLNSLAAHVSEIHAVAGCEGLFYCHWEGCSRSHRGFNARYKMLVHVRTHTNEKPHQCTECNKSFSRAENLKIHARSHTGEKPYVCPVPGCHKAYSNSSDRFKHTRTHSIDKPYTCKVPGCNKRYTDPSSLRKHAKTYNHFILSQRSLPQHNQQENQEIRGRNEEMQTQDKTLHIDYITTQFPTAWLQTWSWGRMEEQDAPLDLTVHNSSYH
ncbi:zinc finger protein GLIS2-like [Macrosteles quadrilineatus]|uniref:zinc finger protein GLIS2-like n=1 Tax=Macrosteles quadrilineatus TaxID=74068 RepID=UPI0023E0E644|nr:zinc finger protein GLIS2-like [Macrosteles quadrilineatus]